MIEDFEDLASNANRDDAEEIEANLFAGAVLLGRNADELVHMCVEEAQYDLARLKQTVQNVAKQQEVPLDVLANCVAFKLSEQGTSWWSTAKTFQEPRQDIHQIATKVLLDFVDLTRLSEPDLNLLTRALNYVEVPNSE
jgi:N-glycosylase/DNA lyase